MSGSHLAFFSNVSVLNLVLEGYKMREFGLTASDLAQGRVQYNNGITEKK